MTVVTVNLMLLTPGVLGRLIEALDRLPLREFTDEAWVLKHALDTEEARRVRIGEEVSYEG